MEMAMPYLKGLDPQRVKAIGRALRTLQLMQREGVMLVMPEIALPR
jgi:hypothetical protein